MGLHVNVARDFSTHPLGRFRIAWPYSGEAFREDHLEVPLRAGQEVTVDLRGTRGLAPSFLEEAFGGLIDAGIPLEHLERLLTIESDDPSRIDEIWLYIRSAAEGE